MRPLITVTGLDDYTDLDTMKKLARPGVEVGILVTAEPKGRGRYPSPKTIGLAVHLLSGRCALHICGRAARQQLTAGGYDNWLLRGVARVQVNGRVSTDEIRTLCDRYPTIEFITQHCDYNLGLAAANTANNHSLLIDSSGGKGLSPSDWLAPLTSKPVGFAGGLGPDNLEQELPRIREAASVGWWVDMESKLRDEYDHFSVELVAQSIDLVLGHAQ